MLISNVLQSMPIHILLALNPPKCMLHELHKVFVRFFWNNKEEGRNKPWIKLCFPKQERGLGFRSLVDVSMALFAML